MRALRRHMLLFIAVFTLVLMPAAANAALLQCDNNGGITGGQLYEADPNAGTGACENISPPMEHVFSVVACNFVLILDAVLDKTYCGIQYSMTSILAAVLSIYVAVFGAQILMGTAQLNSQEILMRLVKIAGVWTFATQSTWGINLAFQFFLGLIGEGTYWVTKVILPAGASPLDPIMPVYSYLDSLAYTALSGQFTQNNAKIIGFFAVMGYTIPYLFAIAAYWLWLTATTLARTLVSFMLGVSAVAFLISLSPIFLSFMLFQVTYVHFESWLRYMMSYSFQVIIVFAVLAMWLSITSLFIGFFGQLSSMIFEIDVIAGEGGPVEDPDATWGICKANYFFNAFGPAAQCQTSTPASKDLIKPTEIPEQGDFMYFVIYNLVSLSLIAFAFSTLMKDAPELARQIVGPAYAPVLGGGWGGNQGMGSIEPPANAADFNRRHEATDGVAQQAAEKIGGSGAGGGSGAPPGKATPVSDFINKQQDLVSKR